MKTVADLMIFMTVFEEGLNKEFYYKISHFDTWRDFVEDKHFNFITWKFQIELDFPGKFSGMMRKYAFCFFREMLTEILTEEKMVLFFLLIFCVFSRESCEWSLGCQWWWLRWETVLLSISRFFCLFFGSLYPKNDTTDHITRIKGKIKKKIKKKIK